MIKNGLFFYPNLLRNSKHGIINGMRLLLETPRLILRQFAERDVESFSRYRSDPEVARYQGWEAPYNKVYPASASKTASSHP